MTDRWTTALTRLRSRNWRLVALVLWATIVLGNLGTAVDMAVAASSQMDIHSLCLASGSPDQPAPAPAPHSDHAAGPHCPLCYVFAAGVLAPPGAVQVLVLAPQSGWSGPESDVLAPPRAPLTATQARPRAPPVTV